MREKDCQLSEPLVRNRLYFVEGCVPGVKLPSFLQLTVGWLWRHHVLNIRRINWFASLWSKIDFAIMYFDGGFRLQALVHDYTSH